MSAVCELPTHYSCPDICLNKLQNALRLANSDNDNSFLGSDSGPLDRPPMPGVSQSGCAVPTISLDQQHDAGTPEIQSGPLAPLPTMRAPLIASRSNDSNTIPAYRKPAQTILPCLERLDVSLSGIKPEYRRLPVTTAAVRLLSTLPSLTHLVLDWRPVNLRTVDLLADSLTRLAYISLDHCFCPRCDAALSAAEVRMWQMCLELYTLEFKADVP